MGRSANDEDIEDVSELFCEYNCQSADGDTTSHIDKEMRPKQHHLNPNVRQPNEKPEVVGAPEKGTVRVEFDQQAKAVDEDEGCRDVPRVPKVLNVMIGHHERVNAREVPVKAD